MIVNSFELAIEVGGKRIPEYGHKGKTYIRGERGHFYTIKFRNNRAERVLAIPSVDGKSTVDGQPCTPSSNGYVVKGYSSLTISGWRTSLSEVNSFKFTDKSGSYAGKTEGTQNCGIVGMVVLAEKLPPPSPVPQIIKEIHHHHDHWYEPPQPPPSPWKPWWSHDYICSTQSPPSIQGSNIGSSSGVTMKCASGQYTASLDNSIKGACFLGNVSIATSAESAPDFNLGTGWGEALADCVTEVAFEKGVILATLEIYYSDRDGLVKDGVQVDKTPELAVFPRAFSGFCKPPV